VAIRQAQLETASHAKRELLATMSHELRAMNCERRSMAFWE